jgi:siroheme synthase (precorrin-2 oxidase/ferrochelatase)
MKQQHVAADRPEREARIRWMSQIFVWTCCDEFVVWADHDFELEWRLWL